MTHINRHTPIYDPRDPECPYDDDFTEDDEDELWEREVDTEIDRMMEERCG